MKPNTKRVFITGGVALATLLTLCIILKMSAKHTDRQETFPSVRNDPEMAVGILNSSAAKHNISNGMLSDPSQLPPFGAEDQLMAGTFFAYGYQVSEERHGSKLSAMCYTGALRSAVYADGKMTNSQRDILDAYLHGDKGGVTFRLAMLIDEIGSVEDMSHAYDMGSDNGQEACSSLGASSSA